MPGARMRKPPGWIERIPHALGDGVRWQDSPAVAGGFVLPGTVPVAVGPVHSVAARVAAPHRTRFDFIRLCGIARGVIRQRYPICRSIAQ